MSKQQAIPDYTVNLLMQAKTLIAATGTEHQHRALSQLQDAVVEFEKKMPKLPDGSIHETM